MYMRNSALLLTLILVVSMLSGCYNKTQRYSTLTADSVSVAVDTVSSLSGRHYSRNYNFIVNCDSLVLQSQQPEEKVSELPIDTFSVYRNEHVVVADIRSIPADTVDSVWVQLANDRAVFGWIHESEMLENVVPDDPISQFINFFSDAHILIFLVFLSIMVVAYMTTIVRKRNVPIVHLRDIDSFFPALLCLIVAASATFYASIQAFCPDAWRHFYYHPTLNPFSVQPLLGIFLFSVWSMLIVGLAAADDVFRRLKFADAVLYLGGVGAVCAVDYVLFSLTTLFYVGYALLATYIFFAVKQYFRHDNRPYVCGNCGHRIRQKGKCPYCGTVNE